MARTLVIKNADFSVNKLDTVSFSGDKPCTAIALSASTASITSIGGTQSLTASLTPADTTDSVIWSSSDSNVATVAGGVITATGCGTATITATCGTVSETCEVTVTHIAELTFILNSYMSKDNGKDFLSGGELSNYASGGMSSGSKLVAYNSGSMFSSLYAVMIPNGATQIVISSQGFKPYGFWVNTNVSASILSEVSYAYAPDDNFKYNGNINDSRTVPIPDRTTGTYEGANACGFVFRCNSTISQEAVNAITVTFSKASS